MEAVGGEEATCCVCYKCLLLDAFAVMVMRRRHLYMYFNLFIRRVNHNDLYVVHMQTCFFLDCQVTIILTKRSTR